MIQTVTGAATEKPRIVMGNPERFDLIEHTGDRQRQKLGLTRELLTYDKKLIECPQTLYYWTHTGKNFEDELEEISITADDIYVYPLDDSWSIRSRGRDALMLSQMFGKRINALKYKIDRLEYARQTGGVSLKQYETVSPEYIEWLEAEWETEKTAQPAHQPQPAVGDLMFPEWY